MNADRWFICCLGLLLMPLLFSIVGCTKSNPVSSDRSDVGIIPLTIGNMWSYDGVAYDTTGAVAETFGELMDVRGDSILFGHHMYSYESWNANTDSGLIAFGGFSYEPDPPPPHDTLVSFELVYQYPTERGASYQSFGSTVSVASTDTVIVVPAGSFHCIDYKWYSQAILLDEVYICPGVGRVKYVGYFGPDYPSHATMVRSAVELKQYSLK